MKKYKIIEPDYDLLPARIDTNKSITGIQADSLGHFPIVIWNQDVSCADLKQTIYIITDKKEVFA
tara:strand:- start:505 stop:699 length:195 start_codon:yes stop_codon:yes gene_type:complete